MPIFFTSERFLRPPSVFSAVWPTTEWIARSSDPRIEIIRPEASLRSSFEAYWCACYYIAWRYREKKLRIERGLYPGDKDVYPTKSMVEKKMVRKCNQQDLSVMYEIINDAAQAYKGVIPEDRWHEPYMPIEELNHEIDDGVEFWGYEETGDLMGVMGFQDKGDVYLIRHAYVRTSSRNLGIGTKLLRHLEQMTDKPILVGTWAGATWAIRFYRKNGYRLLSRSETEELLRKYWKIPERQVVTSVVLANQKWGAGTR